MAPLIVIDDHPSVLNLISSVCRAEGHSVMAFDNGTDGLDAIREFFPSVVLVDRELGSVDGLDIVREVREISPSTRCVMVTACSETRDVVHAMRRGVYNYITKPFEAQAILDAVHEALTEPQEIPLVKQKLVIVYPKQAA
ncbi:response regulator [Prosthecobacter debontii]|nr:response regulator [Prosthecobacter debontii]